MDRLLTSYLVTGVKATFFKQQPVSFYICLLHTAAGNTENTAELSHQITQRVTVLLCKPADCTLQLLSPAQAHQHEVHMSADHLIDDGLMRFKFSQIYCPNCNAKPQNGVLYELVSHLGFGVVCHCLLCHCPPFSNKEQAECIAKT